MAAADSLLARTAPFRAFARYALIAGSLAFLGCESEGASAEPACNVTAVPDELELDPFYEKYCDPPDGLPIMASADVADEALQGAAALVARVLGKRPELRDPIVAAGGRMALLAEDEGLLDIPEVRDANPPVKDPDKSRGLTLYEEALVIAPEENVQCWPTDRSALLGYAVLLHELGHLIHMVGLKDTTREGAEVPFGEEVKAAYEVAMRDGLWTDTYAATDEFEYWAEGVMIYFSGPDTMIETGQEVHVESREALRDYDPRLFELLDWVFGDDPWYPSCPKPPALAGHACSAPYAGDDVMSFAFPEGTGRGTLSGTIHFHGPLAHASPVSLWFRGRSDDLQPVGTFVGGRPLAKQGATEVRYTISNVMAGEYLVSVGLQANQSGAESLWVGTYNGIGEGSGADAVTIDDTHRCGVDVTLTIPESRPAH